MRNYCCLLLLATTTSSYAQLVPFEEIEEIGSPQGPVHYSWKRNGAQLTFLEDGTLLANRKVLMKLPREAGFKPGFAMGGPAIGNVGKDMLVAYITDAGGDVCSYICRMAENLKSAKWCQDIAMNFQVALGKDSIWMGGYGQIGRIDPETGKYIWRHTTLAGAYSDKHDSFNIACPIAEDATTVAFDSDGSNRGTAKKVVLNRVTGEILSVTDIKGGRACP